MKKTISTLLITWPLHIMLPKTSARVKNYDKQTKWIYFLFEGNNLLENLTLFGIKAVVI